MDIEFAIRELGLFSRLEVFTYFFFFSVVRADHVHVGFGICPCPVPYRVCDLCTFGFEGVAYDRGSIGCFAFLAYVGGR